VLIRRPILDRIKSGDINVQFRRWKRLSVKAGGTLTTAIGVLSIKSVEKTTQRSITERDAKRAGYDNREELIAELRRREGDVYRISLEFHGADPRIALRKNASVTDLELTAIFERLRRMDAASRNGHWTVNMLKAIRRYPNLRAADLAEKTGYEKDWLKQNVRKLKNLGLSVSHHPGYTLSPRGEAVLTALTKHGKQK
jgi:hypothetical protein